MRLRNTLTIVLVGKYNRRWRRGGAPSWSRLGGGKCQHRGGKDGTAEEAGDKAVKRVKAAGQAQTKSHVVLKKYIGELRRVLDGKKSSFRKTYKNQAEANDKSLVTERKH